MSLKEALHYDEAADRVEGFEDFGRGQRTPYVANYASGFYGKRPVHKVEAALWLLFY